MTIYYWLVSLSFVIIFMFTCYILYFPLFSLNWDILPIIWYHYIYVCCSWTNLLPLASSHQPKLLILTYSSESFLKSTTKISMDTRLVTKLTPPIEKAGTTIRQWSSYHFIFLNKKIKMWDKQVGAWILELWREWTHLQWLQEAEEEDFGCPAQVHKLSHRPVRWQSL